MCRIFFFINVKQKRRFVNAVSFNLNDEGTISRRSEAIQIVFVPTSRESTVRHIEMNPLIAAARSPQRSMSRRGRRLRYVRLHREPVDRIPMTPMTSRSFQWHGRRSCLPACTKPRASQRRATRRASSNASDHLSAADSAESK